MNIVTRGLGTEGTLVTAGLGPEAGFVEVIVEALRRTRLMQFMGSSYRR